MDKPVRTVEWYRVDESRRIVRVAVTGSLLIMVGSAGVGVALGHLVDAWLQWMLGIVGGALVVAGPLTVIGGFQRLLNADITLAVRTDGLHYRRGATETHVDWDDLLDVRWLETTGALELVRRGSDPLSLTHRFYGFGGKELAKRLNDLRRKALHNLLPR